MDGPENVHDREQHEKEKAKRNFVAYAQVDNDSDGDVAVASAVGTVRVGRVGKVSVPPVHGDGGGDPIVDAIDGVVDDDPARANVTCICVSPANDLNNIIATINAVKAHGSCVAAEAGGDVAVVRARRTRDIFNVVVVVDRRLLLFDFILVVVHRRLLLFDFIAVVVVVDRLLLLDFIAVVVVVVALPQSESKSDFIVVERLLADLILIIDTFIAAAAADTVISFSLSPIIIGIHGLVMNIVELDNGTDGVVVDDLLDWVQGEDDPGAGAGAGVVFVVAVVGGGAIVAADE